MAPTADSIYPRLVRVCITGGTGFVGRSIVRELLTLGHEPVLLVRGASFRRTPPPGASRTTVDLEHPASLAAALTGAKAVIHLVGIISEGPRSDFDHVHRVLTLNVLEAAHRAGVRRLLHMSALGARPDAPARYHQTKWAAEEAVRQSGLEWTIFRPSLIHGAADQVTNLFDRMARWSPCLPVMGSGKSLLQPVSVEAVALAFAASLTHPEAPERTLDLCGPERMTFPDLLRAILAARGRRRVLVHLPLAVMRFQARILEWVCPRLGFAPPLNRDQLIMLQEDNIGDGSEADRMFGLKHVSLLRALQDRWRTA